MFKKLVMLTITVSIALATISFIGQFSITSFTVEAQRPPVDPPGGRPPVDPPDKPGGGSGGGGNSDDDDGGKPSPHSNIVGTVTDICLFQPGAGVEVSVSGAIVRTDGDGRYSITGLNAGDYVVAAVLQGAWQDVTGPVNVALDGVTTVTVNLEYCSIMPTPTPTLVIPELDPVAPGELPESGGVRPVAENAVAWSVFGPFEKGLQLAENLRLAQIENRTFIYLSIPKTANSALQPCTLAR